MRKLGALLLTIGLAFTPACGDDEAIDPGPSASTSASSGDAGSSSSSGAAATSGDESTSSTTTTTMTSTSTTTTTTTATGDDTTTSGTTEVTATTTGDDGTSSATTTTTTGDEDPPIPTIPGPKIKFMTFNIRVGTANDGDNAWDKRKGLVFQVFEDQDADFVGVQEAQHFQLVEIDAAVPGYKRIGVGTHDGAKKGPFNAIYYRKSRFTVDDSDTFWLSDTPGKPGSATWGNSHPRAVTWGHFVEKGSTYSLYVYNTHFDHQSQHSREQSAVLLAKRAANRKVKADPFVVTGDFNAGEANPVTRFLKGNAAIDGVKTEAPMRDTFRVVKPDATNVGTAHGFKGGTGGNKIDYVYVIPKQEVTGAHIDHFNVDGRYPSDHFPVVGTVRFDDKE